MKQLLSQHENLILVGMKDRVFLLDTSSSSSSSTNATILELSKPAVNPAAATDEAKRQHQQQTSQPRRDQAELNDITAVAVTVTTDSGTESTVFCAVSRYDKSLAIYRLNRQPPNGAWQATTSDAILPTIMYHSPKRVGCLTFASLPANGSVDDAPQQMPILISGDMAGDAYAYNLLESGGHRLLLGHTASMLTGVVMLGNSCIATADRDEKIRVSRFPETYIVEGYLLGHTKYVTAIGRVSSNDDNNNNLLLASCGGDKMLRLWNWMTFQELCSISTTTEIGSDNDNDDGIPVDLAVDANGRYIAVVFDGSKHLNLYKLGQDESSQAPTMSLCASIECPSQPLVVTFDDQDSSSERLLVLMTEPHCLASYSIVVEESSGNTSLSMNEYNPSLQALKDMVATESIALPSTILEKDKHGHIVLEKENETRGLTFDNEPWKRTERLAIAKEKQKKRNQKKRDKKKAKLSSS